MTKKSNASGCGSGSSGGSNNNRRSTVNVILFRLLILTVLHVFVTIGTFLRAPGMTDESYFFNNIESFANNLHLPSTEILLQELQKNNSNNGLQRNNIPFPISIRDEDKEVISHPGMKFASKEIWDKLPKTMLVPQFYNPKVLSNSGSGGNNFDGDIRQYLGNHGQRLITREEALSIGSYHEGHETIYISIASYRDPECTTTINSIYLRAKHPQRIRVVVIDQRYPDDFTNPEKPNEKVNDPKCTTPQIPCDEKPNQVLCKYQHLIESYEMDARQAVGPVFARHIGYRYYRGEYFAMQMDAHVRFVQDWDIDVIAQWKSANNEMAVLSTYLSDLNDSIDPETHEGIRPRRPILCDLKWEQENELRHLRLGQNPEGKAMIHGTPTLHPFWGAGFSFARGHFIIQVPYDQHLPMIFQGEEIAIAIRGFTYGYDYYTPERSVCFHMYAILANKEKRDKVPHFWENTNRFKGATRQSMKRLNGVLGLGREGDEYDDMEEQKYGIGNVRTPQKFFFIIWYSCQ